MTDVDVAPLSPDSAEARSPVRTCAWSRRRSVRRYQPSTRAATLTGGTRRASADQRGLSGGQCEGQLGALARLAGGGQLAAMSLGELGGDGQADPAAGGPGRVAAAPEPVEDAGQVLGVYAGASVADLQYRVRAELARVDGDAAAFW